ncbi:MAG: hypothetical protein ACJA1A_003810, partial [Saprospiraceae bacterium]
MKLSNKAVKGMAEDLDCGLVCNIHKEMNEIKSKIDPEDIYLEVDFLRGD